MFGHDNDEDKNDPDVTQPMSSQPVNHGLLGIDDDDSTNPSSTPSSGPSGAPTPPASVDDLSSSSSDSTSPSVSTPMSGPASGPSSPTAGQDDDLLNIKREALQELSPLIDHLEQDSEEKFKTTMMMIQASDNKDLIPQAFQAAKVIKDEKKRAQALLDIVNEINYFTHKSED